MLILTTPYHVIQHPAHSPWASGGGVCGAQPHKEGNQSVETDSWSLKPEFSEIVNFRLRPDGPSTSHREIMIDVCK